jgi:hypothetical protein
MPNLKKLIEEEVSKGLKNLPKKERTKSKLYYKLSYQTRNRNCTAYL